MKVLVTGGQGFIGRAVIERLEHEGHAWRSYDLPFDVRYKDLLIQQASGAEAIIHLAGVLGTHELFDSIDQAIDVNIRGTANVLEACRVHGARFVGISMPPVFKSVYTATKVCSGWLASAFHETYDVPVSHVRAFNAFGPGQAYGPGHPQKILPTFALASWRNEPIPIWGDGEQTVDLIYTGDLARVLVAALDHGDDITIDGGTGTAMTVNQVAALVAQITKNPLKVEYLPMRRGERPTNIVATGEGWDRLGWKPELHSGDLIRAVNWYRDRV